MSKLEELINQHCPDGVEYKPLSKIAKVIRGGNFQKKDFVEKGKPCIHYGQIYTRYGLSTDKTLTYVDEDIWEKSKKAKPGSIVMAVTSENYDDVCKCVVWEGHESVAVSGHTAIIEHTINGRYLAYWFSSSEFYAQKIKIAHGTKVIEVTPSKLEDVEIPVPPLPVQEDIVRILDKMAELEAKLKAELETELDLRKKQYEYYRDAICTFNDTVPRMPLGKLFTFKNGINKEKSCFGHGTPIVNFTDAYNKSRLYISDVIGLVEVTNNELERFKVESGDVFFTRTSETIEEVGFASVIVENINNCIFSGFLIKGHPITNLLLPEYCSYCFRTTSFRKKIVSKAHMTTRATITGEILKDIEIAVPSIDVQKRIVAILDKLNFLTSNITDDLPAEIKMRNQQYEHYRDKLLGFKRLEVA